MGGQAKSQLLERLGISKGKQPHFFSERAQLDRTPRPLPYAHAVRRVWQEMRLNGVLYVDRSPAAYMKEVRRDDPATLNTLHRDFWNHGIAPLLIVSTPSQVIILSSRACPAEGDEPLAGTERLVQQLDATSDALEIEQLVTAVESGQIYTRNSASFDRRNAVDRQLLDSLSFLRQKLIKDLDPATAHALLMRLVFTCYLIERGIVLGHRLDDSRLSNVSPSGKLIGLLDGHKSRKARDILYALFRELKPLFNGSLFDADLETEQKQVTDQHVDLIRRFLRGDDLRHGQQTLDFWAYNFSMIPVETISSIYEEFVEEDIGNKRNASSKVESKKDKKREAGAFYTPPDLAELVVDEAIEGYDTLLDKTVLDPACGSGVFLVSLFNRMAEEWRRKHPTKRSATRARELRKLMRNQVFGIDKENAACRVACFSLYLALLEKLEPSDIHALRKEEEAPFLPPLLLEHGQQLGEEPRTVVEGNFFDPNLRWVREKFDIIVGNPPWVSRGNSTDPLFLEWRETDPDVLAPGKQIACGFLWQAPKRLEKNGRCALLVPSAILLNKHTNKFQKAWLKHHTLERAVQLSDVRHLLFDEAIHPAVILRFNGRPPETADASVEYVVPKADGCARRTGTITVYEGDRKTLRLEHLLRAATAGTVPTLWKKHFWGTPRDVELVDRLAEMPQLSKIAGRPNERKRWVKGQGFKPIRESDDPSTVPKAWWSENHLFAEARRFARYPLVLLPQDYDKVVDRFRLLHCLPNAQIFTPPLVLVNQGFSNAAFVDFPVLFQHSLQSISGPTKDRNLLRFLCAVLTSNTLRHFLFHTSANWGTERGKVHFFELMETPFPLPEQTLDPDKSREIVGQVASQMKQLAADIRKTPADRARLVESVKPGMEEAVGQYFDIDPWERILIEDTVDVIIPSIMPKPISRKPTPTLEDASEAHRRQYVTILCDVLNGWARRGQERVSGEVVYAKSAGAAVATLTRGTTSTPYVERSAPSELAKALSRLRKTLPRRAGALAQLRGVKIFDEDKLHIVKPLTRRSWLKSTALNDADEIAAAILKSPGGGNQ